MLTTKTSRFLNIILLLTVVGKLSASCPKNTSLATGIKGRCFQYINKSQTFSVALDDCKSRGQKLFEPQTKDELLKIKKKFSWKEGSIWLNYAKTEVMIDTHVLDEYWASVTSFNPMNDILWYEKPTTKSACEYAVYYIKSGIKQATNCMTTMHHVCEAPEN
ncbi:uncharacterized protein LOC142345501 [Convolutriloba macropyga]|uniref:uncharacterized protein LOC142345501 n=1 Tax=Convolutriloba macropyga TaxID=536237 RepID=UPI003F526685